MGSCDNPIGAENCSLPFSYENDSGIRSSSHEVVPIPILKPILFPSPLTCTSIEDFAYMDEDNQNMKSHETEPDYEEIGIFYMLRRDIFISSIFRFC